MQRPSAWVTTRLVSAAADGTSGDDVSFTPVLSADGRFVAFGSWVPTLVVEDTNATSDVFVRDLLTGAVERVSLGSGGSQVDGPSGGPAISADGRFVAFHSQAKGLVDPDGNGQWDIFVRDRTRSETEPVSVSANGLAANGHSIEPAISADGRLVAFRSWASDLVESDPNGSVADVFVRDRQAQATIRVADGFEHALSGDGRTVAVASAAADLVSDDRNTATDVLVKDLDTGVMERVSVSSAGVEGDLDSSSPALSADGRLVAFDSDATMLVPDDTNGVSDVFVRDRLTMTTERVSLDPEGGESAASSFAPAISPDGRWVVFLRGAALGFEVWIHDRAGGTTELVSLAIDASEADGPAYFVAIGGDEPLVAFEAAAGNLVPSDANGRLQDAFLAENVPPRTTTTSTAGASSTSTTTTSTTTTTRDTAAPATSTTTHVPPSSTTSTTLPAPCPGSGWSSLHCLLETELPPAACASEPMPRRCTKALSRARTALAQVEAARPRQRARLLQELRRRLGAATRAFVRAARARRAERRLSPACAQAAVDVLKLAKARSRGLSPEGQPRAEGGSGKITPELAVALAAAGPNDRLRVYFVVAEPRRRDGKLIEFGDVVAGPEPLAVGLRFLTLVSTQIARPLEESLRVSGCTEIERFWIVPHVWATCVPEVIVRFAERDTVTTVDQGGVATIP